MEVIIDRKKVILERIRKCMIKNIELKVDFYNVQYKSLSTFIFCAHELEKLKTVIESEYNHRLVSEKYIIRKWEEKRK